MGRILRLVESVDSVKSDLRLTRETRFFVAIAPRACENEGWQSSRHSARKTNPALLSTTFSMSPTTRIIAFVRFLLIAMALGLQGHGISCAEILVVTNDERELVGEVDSQTNEEQLWIRQEKADILLTTAIAWSQVAAVVRDGEQLPQDALFEVLSAEKTDEPAGFLATRIVPASPEGCTLNCSELREPLSPRPIQVQSLQVEAYLVNLDRDVEPDGIEIILAALDEFGEPVPVKGNLVVELWGEWVHTHGSHIRFEELQRWSQPVMPVDFTDGLVRYALRFRTVQPEFDLRLNPDALVHARLGVFGQGNYSASAPVVIRKLNPYRDRLQYFHGSRFVPGELTSETHSRQWLQPHNRWRYDD